MRRRSRGASRPENLARLKDCGVYFLDASEDMYAVTLNYLGKDPNSRNVADYEAATNLLLMAGAAIAARFIYQGLNHLALSQWSDYPVGFRIVFLFAVVNLSLGVFNLLPIPPLDGSALLERALPRAWLPGWEQFRPYGLFVLLLLVVSGRVPGHLFDPLVRQLYSFVLR